MAEVDRRCRKVGEGVLGGVGCAAEGSATGEGGAAWAHGCSRRERDRSTQAGMGQPCRRAGGGDDGRGRGEEGSGQRKCGGLHKHAGPNGRTGTASAGIGDGGSEGRGSTEEMGMDRAPAAERAREAWEGEERRMERAEQCRRDCAAVDGRMGGAGVRGPAPSIYDITITIT